MAQARLEDLARAGGAIGEAARLQYFYQLERSSNANMRDNIMHLREEVDEALARFFKRSKKYRQSEEGMREYFFLAGQRSILSKL